MFFWIPGFHNYEPLLLADGIPIVNYIWFEWWALGTTLSLLHTSSLDMSNRKFWLCIPPLCWLVLNIILDRSSVFGWFLPHSNVLQLLNHQNGWSLVQRPRCFATMVNAYARATAVEGADRWLSVMEKDESRGKPGVNQYRNNKPPIFWWFKKHHKTPK